MFFAKSHYWGPDEIEEAKGLFPECVERLKDALILIPGITIEDAIDAWGRTSEKSHMTWADTKGYKRYEIAGEIMMGIYDQALEAGFKGN